MEKKAIAIIATLDTKGPEAGFVKTSLEKEGTKFDVFDKVLREPPARVVVVGLAGGISLDTAKGAAIMGIREGSAPEICGMEIILRREGVRKS